jgi:hypothetical protein
VRFAGAFHARQELHRGDRRNGGIISAEHGIHVDRAALGRDKDAGVEDNSPGHPRTSLLKAERRSSCALKVVREADVRRVIPPGGLEPVSRRPPLRKEPTNRYAVTRDDDSLAMLDLIKDVCEWNTLTGAPGRH